MAISSIGSAPGRDYADLFAWIADLPAILTEQEVAEMYNDSEFTSGSSIVVSGVTATPTFNLVIRAAAGEGFNDTVGPLRYDVSRGVGIRRTSPYGITLDVRAPYTEITGIQIATTGTQNSRPCSVNANSAMFRECLIQGGSAFYTLRFQTQNSDAINNVIVNRGSGIGIQAIYSAPRLINNTIVKVGTASSTGITKSGGASNSLLAINNAIFNFSTAMSAGTYGAGTDYNGTDAASLPAGTNNQLSLVYADQFEDINLATLDLRLKSGNDLDGSGTPRAETNGVDIFGTTRDATNPSISAFETAGATGIDITPTSVNTSWSAFNYGIDLTGEISVTPNSVNTAYNSNNYTIELTGEIAITPTTVNTSYAANNYSIDLSGLISVNPNSTGTSYTANDYTVTLQGAIEITPESVNTNWLTNSYTINLSQVVYNGKRVKRVNAKRKHVKISAINKVKRFN